MFGLGDSLTLLVNIGVMPPAEEVIQHVLYLIRTSFQTHFRFFEYHKYLGGKLKFQDAVTRSI